jgi:hypothetical protein
MQGSLWNPRDFATAMEARAAKHEAGSSPLEAIKGFGV